MKDLNLKPILREGAIELLCTGRLTMANSPEFETYMLGMMKEDGHKAIGLNMKFLEMVDSSGLSILIKLVQESKQHGVELIYFGASEAILSVIRMARLNTLLYFTTESSFDDHYPVVG